MNEGSDLIVIGVHGRNPLDMMVVRLHNQSACAPGSLSGAHATALGSLTSLIEPSM